jgi:iron complex outermembrane recepter protein
VKHQRISEPRFILSAVAAAVLALANTAAAQEAPMQRVEVTGSSIKRLATENALPLTTIKAEELQNRGLTTMSEVAPSPLPRSRLKSCRTAA